MSVLVKAGHAKAMQMGHRMECSHILAHLSLRRACSLVSVTMKLWLAYQDDLSICTGLQPCIPRSHPCSSGRSMGTHPTPENEHVCTQHPPSLPQAMKQPPRLWVCGHIHEAVGEYRVPHPARPEGILLVNAATFYAGAAPGA